MACTRLGCGRRCNGRHNADQFIADRRDGGWVYHMRDCTCLQTWGGSLPPPPCPVHGGAVMPVVTYGTNTNRLDITSARIDV